jgi:hypothetical protein
MSWPSLKTWTASVVTVLDLNTEIRDRMALLKTSIADDGTINAGTATIDTLSITTGVTSNAGAGNFASLSGRLRSYGEYYQTVTPSAGVVSFDIASGNHVVLNHTADVTSFTITVGLFGFTAGTVYPIVLYIKHNGTPHTITWTVNGGSVKFSSNVAPTLSSANGAYDRVVLYYAYGLEVFGEQIGYNS